MHAAAVSAIVAFLTDSLIPFFHPLILHAVRLHLRVTIPSFFASNTDLCISPCSKPPTLLACTPVPFSQWIVLLGNQPIRIVVSSTQVKAIIDSRTAMLWRKDSEQDLSENPTPKTIYRGPIRVPSLPIHIALPIIDDDTSSSSDSDTESDDGYTSEDSMTSVSSIRSLYSATKPSTIPAPLPAVTPLTTYLYQGGKTNVVTGGVMLGKPADPKPLARASAIAFTKFMAPKVFRPAFPKTRRAPVGPDSANWRRRD